MTAQSDARPRRPRAVLHPPPQPLHLRRVNPGSAFVRALAGQPELCCLGTSSARLKPPSIWQFLYFEMLVCVKIIYLRTRLF